MKIENVTIVKKFHLQEKHIQKSKTTINKYYLQTAYQVTSILEGELTEVQEKLKNLI